MSAELLRRAAKQIRADMVEAREFYESEGALNRIEASECVADWLEYQPDYAHLTRHISESDAPERLARAYLGEDTP